MQVTVLPAFCIIDNIPSVILQLSAATGVRADVDSSSVNMEEETHPYSCYIFHCFIIPPFKQVISVEITILSP